jgi:bacterioferritin-associated ferredoxin
VREQAAQPPDLIGSIAIANASHYRYIGFMIVCVCNAIRETDVRKAAREGASCPTSAYGRFGRKPRCGQCFSFAREVIAAERATA